MRAELIGVGTELLLGQIPNTNAQWISEQLAAIGVDVMHHQVVGDNLERIVEAFRTAASRADVVISTGGLGPTQDDITRDALAAAAGATLQRYPEIEDLLRQKFERIGREMPESNLVQALVPSGGRYITPLRGTAPGLALELDGARIYAVPGVPAEMREMMEGTIIPELAADSDSVIVSRVLRSTGIAESKVDELMRDLFDASTNPTVAYLASAGEVKVRLTAKASTAAEAEAIIAPVAEQVAARLGDFCFTRTNEELPEAVGRLLRESNKTVACAESLTGGSVASRITSVAGASYYFVGGAICYTPEAKEKVLGVSHETLLNEGVVSAACAREMAEGARRLYGADIAVGLTGAAGPTPHEGAEPGFVWVAIAAEGLSHARGFRSPGAREQVRRWSEQAALDLIRRVLEGRPLPD
jgi:nicotinamide-nucleotide amidase